MTSVCLFGASISCAIFQSFSDALKYLIEFRTQIPDSVTNYLDDFLFLALTILACNFLIQSFLNLCQEIGVPIALDKTEWASECVVFLGILLDGRHLMLRLPMEKRQKAIAMLQKMVDKKKSTVKELQQLCGYLNFLCKAIFPGRPFIRRMYAKYSKIMKIPSRNCYKEAETALEAFSLKQYHHVRLDAEFKADCKVWLQFLADEQLYTTVNRPMIDLLAMDITSEEICFCSDASASSVLGYGCIYQTKWISGIWEREFIQKEKPSIEYLELFTLCAGLFTWESFLTNCRIIIFCDNISVCHMLNKLTSSCKNCMVLIRMLTLNGLRFNRRVKAKYISTKANFLADALSRNQLKRFRRLGPQMNENS